MFDRAALEIHLDTPAPPLAPGRHTPCYENLDKIGWPHHFAFECFGARTAIRSKSVGLLEDLRTRVPEAAHPYDGAEVDQVFSAIEGGRQPNSRIRGFHMLYQNHMQLVRSHKRAELFSTFETWLPVFLAHIAPEDVFVHAGVVGWKGRAIVIPGQSHSGKTSLVQELVKAGADYFSDEYAVIGADDSVHPYPKPLSIKSTGTLVSEQRTVEQIGGQQAEAPAAIGLVVMTEYKEGAKWRPRRLSPAQGVLALLSNTVAVQSAPERCMQRMVSVAENARIVRSPRGEASDAAKKILAIAERAI